MVLPGVLESRTPWCEKRRRSPKFGQFILVHYVCVGGSDGVGLVIYLPLVLFPFFLSSRCHST